MMERQCCAICWEIWARRCKKDERPLATPAGDLITCYCCEETETGGKELQLDVNSWRYICLECVDRILKDPTLLDEDGRG